MPFERMDVASSSSRSGWKLTRGCMGLGSIASIGNRAGGRSWTGEGAAAAATAIGEVVRGGRSADNPLPSALRCLLLPLFILQNLLGQFNIAFRPPRPRVIHQDRLSIAWCLCEAYGPRNDRRERFLAEKLFQVIRSEEHTSELQSPYVISYAVFCLKKKKKT